jgi:hypothetical protein
MRVLQSPKCLNDCPVLLHENVCFRLDHYHSYLDFWRFLHLPLPWVCPSAVQVSSKLPATLPSFEFISHRRPTTLTLPLLLSTGSFQLASVSHQRTEPNVLCTQMDIEAHRIRLVDTTPDQIMHSLCYTTSTICITYTTRPPRLSVS